jgi:hypothetical protein
LQRHVEGTKHDSHSALPEEALDLVIADHIPDGGQGRRRGGDGQRSRHQREHVTAVDAGLDVAVEALGAVGRELSVQEGKEQLFAGTSHAPPL